MDKSNRNALLFLSIAALFILLGIVFGKFKGSRDAEAPSEAGTKTIVSTKKSRPIMSYTEALAMYEGKRIQLDRACQATPNNMTFKNGASFMIDNRSEVTRTVNAGSVFSVAPWGFKIVTASASSLPVIWHIDCDGAQNVASILIQK